MPTSCHRFLSCLYDDPQKITPGVFFLVVINKYEIDLCFVSFRFAVMNPRSKYLLDRLTVRPTPFLSSLFRTVSSFSSLAVAYDDRPVFAITIRYHIFCNTCVFHSSGIYGPPESA